jgi:phosphate/sulfate permease
VGIAAGIAGGAAALTAVTVLPFIKYRLRLHVKGERSLRSPSSKGASVSPRSGSMKETDSVTSDRLVAQDPPGEGKECHVLSEAGRNAAKRTCANDHGNNRSQRKPNSFRATEHNYENNASSDINTASPERSVDIEEAVQARSERSNTSKDENDPEQHKDSTVAAIHINAEEFPDEIEFVFRQLQVFSAIAVIFAHGAGEVGYIAGPPNEIYNIIRTGSFDSDSSDSKVWVIMLAALSLVCGLMTYGHHLMEEMGTAMCKLSPSRGFAVELATAAVMVIGSQYGLLVSSAQGITGGILGAVHTRYISHVQHITCTFQA